MFWRARVSAAMRVLRVLGRAEHPNLSCAQLFNSCRLYVKLDKIQKSAAFLISSTIWHCPYLHFYRFSLKNKGNAPKERKVSKPFPLKHHPVHSRGTVGPPEERSRLRSPLKIAVNSCYPKKNFS